MPQASPNFGGGIFSALNNANPGGGMFGGNPAQDFGSQVTGNAGFANTTSSINPANFTDSKFLKARK
jgi:hypothetical protein